MAQKTIGMCSLIVGFLLFIGLTSNAQANDREKALKYLRAGKDEQAFVLMKKAAQKGDAEAQQYVGAMYEFGKGTKTDINQAAVWFRKAAEQGKALAQYSMGIYYEKGTGVAKDPKEAVKWMKMAADKDIPDAQSQLGTYYLDGSIGYILPGWLWRTSTGRQTGIPLVFEISRKGEPHRSIQYRTCL